MKAGSLHFTGGEPLLNFELIEAIAGYAEARARELQISLEFFLTTNGLILSERVIDVLRRYHFHVNVSLDGPPAFHDQARKRPDGTGSYQHISANLKHALRVDDIDWTVNVVIRHGSSLTEALNHVLDLGFRKIEFLYVFAHPGQAVGLTREDKVRLMEEWSTVAAHFAQDVLDSPTPYMIRNLQRIIVMLHHHQVSPRYCEAGLGSVAVAPNGNVYPCQRLGRLPDFYLGDVRQGYDAAGAQAFAAQLDVRYRPPCATCWARFLCRGGCYANVWQYTQQVGQPYRDLCGVIQQECRAAIQTYFRLLHQNPVPLAKVLYPGITLKLLELLS